MKLMKKIQFFNQVILLVEIYHTFGILKIILSNSYWVPSMIQPQL